MTALSDRAHVRAQYRNADKFDARVRLYERYARDPEPWLGWLFRQLALEPGARLLDVGSGTANVWRENAAGLPSGVRVALADSSLGMLREGLARGTGLGERASSVGADAQALPFADARFDVALANHMLYHVPDRPRALRELARVLRPGGRLVVGTNDWTHLIELRELCHRLGVPTSLRPPAREAQQFDLETAADELAPIFGRIRVARRLDTLEITDAKDLGAYVRSTGTPDSPELEALVAHVADTIDRTGAFFVTAAAGVLTGEAKGRT